MEEYVEFVKRTLRILGLNDAAENFHLSENDEDLEKVAHALWQLNEFLYVTTDRQKGDEISAYHQFWKRNCAHILKLGIDSQKCRAVAERLEHVFANPGSGLRPSLPDGLSLTQDQIANARFFTAVQDFTIGFDRHLPYRLAKKKPEMFDADKILNDDGLIDELLRELGADSQHDKRRQFARLSAQLLQEDFGGSAANIAKINHNDAVKIRDCLVHNPDQRYEGKLGISDKKANMLIRDMYELKVWNNLTNLEMLDVSSDANTMRIALRLGILRSRIPLLASYLDVYCYQYGEVDFLSSQAWRRVWDEWGKIPHNHRVAAPGFFDFFIFRIGQICCKPNRRACEKPCRSSSLDKLRELVPLTDGYCPFKGLEEETARMLNPPKSISRLGRTGWKKGKTNMGGGGGISS
jgi:hypothetical protein